MSRVPRIAIVSDPLVQRGGAERVVEAFAEAFPEAPIFSLLYSAKTGPTTIAKRVKASWLNSIPAASSRHRLFLPFYRYAIESIDVSQFDIILSSHHSVAKAVLSRADQLHICYCHTPMRALWERPNEEIRTLPRLLRPAASMLFSHLRVWDAVSAARVQMFIANSTVTQQRIGTYYRRDSRIIFPPIDTSFFTPEGIKSDYYLVASRPVPYKRIDLAVEAVVSLGRRLKIVGGHAKRSQHPNVEQLGHVTNEELRSLMRGARALLFPQLEDFGMTPLEVNACGTPVIAYAAGGALDYVSDGKNGILFEEQTVSSLATAIKRFEQTSYDPDVIRNHAMVFSKERFVNEITCLVEDLWNSRVSVSTGAGA